MTLQHRNFLKAMAGYAGLGALAPMTLPSTARAAAPNFNDYRALVCIYLHGGNDVHNMFVPLGNDALRGYSPYAEIRAGLAVEDRDLGLDQITSGGGNLNQGQLGSGAANPYNRNLNQASAYLSGHYPLSGKGVNLGVNGVMPELAQLFTDDRLLILGSTGTLVRPVTREQIRNRQAELPLFLFAHNHQQRELQTGQANNLDDIGWAGKIADQWNGINQAHPLGLNISYAGNDRLMMGQQTSPLVLKSGALPEVYHLSPGGAGNEDRRALFLALAGMTSTTDRLSFDTQNTATTADPLRDFYNRSLNRSLTTFEQLNQSWNAVTLSYATRGPYGEALFDIPDAQTLGFASSMGGGLIRQLEAVAKMVHLGANGDLGPGYNRQIFYVQLGGFDTHATQSSSHPLLLRELSLGLWKFYKAMEELGHADQVTSFTMSDFGRTLSYNGDGTDHGWGSHQIVMGGYGTGAAGTFEGGRLLGSLPDLTLSGEDDYSDKGRMIPKLAQDQVNAALVEWLGADPALIRSLFPNLTNFQTTSDPRSAYAQLFA
ncbi:MAG: DUF1501 domain-containing protein [Candidatus Thiodiazotropha sp.]